MLSEADFDEEKVDLSPDRMNHIFLSESTIKTHVAALRKSRDTYTTTLKRLINAKVDSKFTTNTVC